MSACCRYIGIDYSGAEPPESSLKGLRFCCAVGESAGCGLAMSWRRRWAMNWTDVEFCSDAWRREQAAHG